MSQAVEEGDESSMPNELMHLAQLECWSGNWPLAARYAEESFELAEQVGQSFGGPPAMRALIDAHLGNVERARATVESRLEVVEESRWPCPLYLRVLGFLELSLGDAAAAEPHLSRTVEIAESFGIREPGVFRVHADLIEALIGDGRARPGRSRCSESSRRGPGRAGSRGRSRPARAAAGCCSPLTASSTRPSARSRTRCASTSGCRCRSSARGRCSRSASSSGAGTSGGAPTSRLEQALAIFEELGAPLWAARARRELRPLGGRPTSRVTLTPAEQRVAELAASGLTNRQVAAALFISPKTVESSLARAYRKLEIRSRAELGAHIAAGDRSHGHRRSRAGVAERSYRGKHPLRAERASTYGRRNANRSTRRAPSVTTFMAECFWPGVTAEVVEAAASASDRRPSDSSDGPARYLGSILVPTDEIALCLFEAASTAAAAELNRRAALPSERILEIVFKH